MMRARTSPSSHRRGYTLVEVLVTVTVMGLAAAIIVPNMLQGGTLGVQAGARMIISDLLYAQNEAMAQQSDRRVVFDIANNRYRVERFDSGSSAWVMDHNPVLSGGNNNYQVDFNQDTRFRGIEIVSADFNGASQIEFDDLGNPSSGGTVRIQFDSIAFDVKVAPFTGRVTVEEAAD